MQVKKYYLVLFILDEDNIKIYAQEMSLSRVNEPGQEETDQRVMTLFPALNLEALRVATDTLQLQRQLMRQMMLVQVPNQLRLSEEAIQKMRYVEISLRQRYMYQVLLSVDLWIVMIYEMKME
ncbi:Hypothetical_protein [Hexamita inflata]|uniref:Hypothetical_protein n=1 Tax=Hexamita inflata TaxID=28002 RepID=A0ABP1GUS6_9EUKA